MTRRRTVVKYRKGFDHRFHGGMTLITLGMWAPIWMLAWTAHFLGPRPTIRMWEYH